MRRWLQRGSCCASGGVHEPFSLAGPGVKGKGDGGTATEYCRDTGRGGCAVLVRQAGLLRLPGHTQERELQADHAHVQWACRSTLIEDLVTMHVRDETHEDVKDANLVNKALRERVIPQPRCHFGHQHGVDGSRRPQELRDPQGQLNELVD